MIFIFFFFLAKFRTKLLGTLKQKSNRLLLCTCIQVVDWITVVFDFSLIITCEAPLHIGEMTLPFCRRLGSKMFKDLMNILRYRYTSLQKGNRQRNWRRLANQSTELKPKRILPVKRLADQPYCVLSKKYWKLVLFVWMLQLYRGSTHIAGILHVITVLLLSCSRRADEIEMIMTDLERANQVGF